MIWILYSQVQSQLYVLEKSLRALHGERHWRENELKVI